MLLGTSGKALASQNIKEVIKVYDAYIAAVKTGKADKILVYYSAQQQKDIRKSITKKDQREDFVMMARLMLPESYEVKHAVWSRTVKRQTSTLKLSLLPCPRLIAAVPAWKHAPLRQGEIRLETECYHSPRGPRQD